jgi:ligand-binding SRPBCC domain-containing protein
MYRLERVQKLPISFEKAWDFFSSPDNLKVITPSYLDFKIISGGNTKMHPGLMIKYTVKPLLGIPVTWVTEITHVDEQKKIFVDEQRVGPYSIWHHQHHFKEIPNGIEMTDIVHYQLPFGILGRIAHPILVKGKLEEIFAFRNAKMLELFGQYKDQ